MAAVADVVCRWPGGRGRRRRGKGAAVAVAAVVCRFVKDMQLAQALMSTDHELVWTHNIKQQLITMPVKLPSVPAHTTAVKLKVRIQTTPTAVELIEPHVTPGSEDCLLSPEHS